MLSYRNASATASSYGERSYLYRRRRSFATRTRFTRKTGSVTTAQSVQKDVSWSSSSSTECKRSAIVFNATLANGYQSGQFVDHGDLGTMSVCQDLCCQSHACDVAFMAGKRCFSVHCHNQAQCLWMPAKDNKYLLQLSYIASPHSIQNSASSLKGVTREKTTPAVSRIPFKVEHRTTAQSVSRNGIKEKASPTSRKTTQARPHDAVKISQEKTKPTKSQKPHSKEMKIELKSKDVNHTESTRNISATSVAINSFSTQTVPKQSEINEHSARSSPANVRASSVATTILPSTLYALKTQSLAENKTSVFMNSTEMLEPPKKVITQSRTTSHSRQPKPMLASSLIFYSKASTSSFGGSSKYRQ
ncbi:hypothetical protein ACROYT_G032460 [Oculina patagonica]